MRSIIFVMMVVISATMSYAGFLDGIKKIGGGVAEAVGGAVDATVNVTTSAVQTISVSSTAPDEVKPEVNKPVSTSSILASPATAIETPVAKIDNATTLQDDASYAKDRADLEKRLQSFRFREDFRSIASVSEKNRIADRVTVVKSNLMRLPHKAEGNASQQLKKMLDEETEIVAAVKKVLNKESEARVAREKAAATAREFVVKQQDDKNAEMIQAMKDTVAMLKELHDSSELDEFVKWDDENNSRFHGSRYVGHTARERAYNKIRTEGLQDISGYDIIAIDHLPAETLADVPEYMMSVDGRGGISIPKTAKSVESYKAAIGKLLSEEREIVRKKKEVVERAAKERADSEKAERDALAKAHETLANIHAKAAGSPDGYQFKPVTVFRKVHLGMSAKEVCEALDMKDAKKFLDDASDYKKWNYGKAIKVTLPSHTLYLQFAYITGDGAHEQYMLVSAQLEFNDKENAPDVATVCSKYEQLKGVKASKDRRVTGHNWKDGVNAFWHSLYDTAMFQVAMTEQTGSGEHGPLTDEDKVAHKRLKLDLESIREEYMTPTYESIDVFEVDGMQVRVISSTESKTTTLITFEDGLISDKLVKLKERVTTNKAKAAAEAKAEAEKKAKAAAVDF